MVEQLLHDLNDWLNIYDPVGTKIAVSRELGTNSRWHTYWAECILGQRRAAGLPDHVPLEAA